MRCVTEDDKIINVLSREISLAQKVEAVPAEHFCFEELFLYPCILKDSSPLTWLHVYS